MIISAVMMTGMLHFKVGVCPRTFQALLRHEKTGGKYDFFATYPIGLLTISDHSLTCC
jgi:hypothetical protein